MSEETCAIISACLPTLRPLKLKLAGQRGTARTAGPSQSGESGGKPTELVVVNGTSGKSAARQFQRFGNEGERFATEVTIGGSNFRRVTPSDGDSTGDEVPLKHGIMITVCREVQWTEARELSSSKGSSLPDLAGREVV
jgi:hypothetical protein